MDLSRISLASARLSLEPLSLQDIPEVFAAVTPSLTRFMAFEPSPSIEVQAEACRGLIAKTIGGTELHVAIRLAAGREFLGITGIHRLGTAEPELGIWIKEAAHGHGYGREAIGGLVAWASGLPGHTGFIYPVAEQNHASRRIPERLNGTIVGERSLRKASGVELKLLVYRIPSAAAS